MLRALLEGFALAVLVLIVGLCLSAQATTAGPNFPTALFNDSGVGTQWINPSNAGATDGVFATYTTSTAGSMANGLDSNQYGFAIPGTATVNGIQFNVLWKESVSGAFTDTGPTFCNGSFAICTTRGNNSSSTITTTLATTVYGGSSDTWGGMVASDVNSTSSTLFLFADKNGATSAILSVDSITMTVFYTAASGNHFMSILGVGSHALPRIYPVPDCPVKRAA